MRPPQPVTLRFVRAAPASVTLDFVVPSGKDAIDSYELQYRLLAEAGEDPIVGTVDPKLGTAPAPDGAWTTASSSLKSARCTKSALKAGAAYTFRARACTFPDLWGPYGPATPPIRTLLPDLPDNCSESECHDCDSNSAHPAAATGCNFVACVQLPVSRIPVLPAVLMRAVHSPSKHRSQSALQSSPSFC